MYTLRIVTKNQGSELNENHYLGESYEVIMKITRPDDLPVDEPDEPFKIALDNYYKSFPNCIRPEGTDAIIGFVYANCKSYPIKDNHSNNFVVYIVSSNGKTFERIYGQNHRY